MILPLVRGNKISVSFFINDGILPNFSNIKEYSHNFGCTLIWATFWQKMLLSFTDFGITIIYDYLSNTAPGFDSLSPF